MRYCIGVLALCVTVMCSEPRAFAADQAADKAAIEKAIESYTAAFNAKDAKALAAHWSPEAVYINPLTGNQVEGREAIAKEFTATLAALKNAKLAVEVESIRFISPGVAVENGAAIRPVMATAYIVFLILIDTTSLFLNAACHATAAGPPSTYSDQQSEGETLLTSRPDYQVISVPSPAGAAPAGKIRFVFIY